MKKTRFIASYSGGKDSSLAIYKAIQEGLEPQTLLVTWNEDQNASWFHSVPEVILKRTEEALGIPLRLIRTGGDDYEKNFEDTLREEWKQGAEICVFGDIDLHEHLEWGRTRCQNIGLKAIFPLWNKERKDVVEDFIKSGFTTHITVVNTDLMDRRYLGKQLTAELMKELEKDGVDVCGENGEFHTFVSDGPLFRHPVEFHMGEPVEKDHYVILPIEP